jgi:nucleoside-diphosphate-sugar epimerase
MNATHRGPVLVTGGRGKTGSEVVRQLAARGGAGAVRHDVTGRELGHRHTRAS